jgi:hypothetical protein
MCSVQTRAVAERAEHEPEARPAAARFDTSLDGLADGSQFSPPALSPISPAVLRRQAFAFAVVLTVTHARDTARPQSAELLFVKARSRGLAKDPLFPG